MARSERHRAELPHGRLPNRLDSLVFAGKVAALRTVRAGQNLMSPVALHKAELQTSFPRLLAECATPLWRETNPAEQALERGKVHNLRRASKRLDGVVVPAGEVFSFWRQLGKATGAKGYVDGRQLQEGCLVPAIGGGLCQLSNALYEVALKAGFEIVERHPHTRIVPGSAAEQGRDATVAWNHIDLRFRSTNAFRLRVLLDQDSLRVQVWGETFATQRKSELPVFRSSKPVQANSCASCGETECHRNIPAAASFTSAKSAVLMDRASPEFAQALGSAAILCVPLRKKAGPVDFRCFKKVYQEVPQALVRSYHSRRLAQQGPERRQHELDSAASLARAMAKRLDHDVTDLVVDIKFLAELWRQGELGGRRYDVLMTRWPMAFIHEELDKAARLYPKRGLLSDFRASEDLVRDEMLALEGAGKVWTPNSWLAGKFGRRSKALTWVVPSALTWTPGDAIAFPGPTAARKGAYEVRELAKATGRPVVTLGSQLEGDDFWSGVEIRTATPEDWLKGVHCVVAPSVVEERPARLLQAVASGVPVIASPQCGLAVLGGVTELDDWSQAPSLMT